MNQTQKDSQRILRPLLLAVVALFAFLGIGASAWAAQYFVMDTIAETGITNEEAHITTQLVKSSVTSRPNETLTENQYDADYVLQPRLLRLGSNYILTVEKRQGDEILFAAQSKFSRIEQLDGAARNVTIASINEPSLEQPRRGVASEPAPAIPYRVEAPPAPSSRSAASSPPVIINVPPAQAGATSQTPVVDGLPPTRKVSYWTIGVGPFLPRHLDTEDMMYNFTLGHTWDINPRASVKILGEANFSSSAAGARLLNIGAGANFFLPGSIDSAPYLTGDIGYGYAEDANDRNSEGFSFGTGVGYQFFRDTETTLDLLLRYSVILEPIDNTGNPAVIGARLAVNF